MGRLLKSPDSTDNITGAEVWELLAKRGKSLYQNDPNVERQLGKLSKVFEDLKEGLHRLWSCVFEDKFIGSSDWDPLAHTYAVVSIDKCKSLDWASLGKALSRLPSLTTLKVAQSGSGD